MMWLWPKESGKFISDKAKYCFIDHDGVKKCAKLIAEEAEKGMLDVQEFKQNEVLPLKYGLSKEDLMNWVFFVDSLNFSFWTSEEIKFDITHNGIKHTGYMAMVNGINRAISEGKRIFDPKCYSALTIDDFKEIFKTDNGICMPLIEERVEVAHEAGNILLDKFNGSFKNVFEMANGDALELVKILVREFPSFQDVHSFEGSQVAILKRAQILVADLYLMLSLTTENDKTIDGIDQLSMFADYRVPQALCYLGVISYNDELLADLKEERNIESGSQKEVEIRGVSIHATELIVEEAKKMIESKNLKVDINSVKVDYYLWDYRRRNAAALKHIPYHRTRCIYY